MTASPLPTVGGDTNVWGTKLNKYLSDRLAYRIDVKADFGAVGDGTTDDTAAIQAAINSVDLVGNDRGGVIFFPRGLYKVSGLTYNGAAPISFVGEVATMGNITGTNGANIVPAGNNQTLLTIGSGTTIYEGCHIENLNFYGNGFTGCTGLKMDSCSHWTGVRIGCKDLNIGIEVRASATSDSAWNVLIAPSLYNCLTAGLKVYDGFGLVILGGDFNISDPGAGQAYGVYITGGVGEASQSIKLFGTFFDSQNHPSAGRVIGIFVERGHECLFEGCKFEQLDTGVELTNLDGADSTAGAANVVQSCTVVGSVGDIGIQVDANASDTFIINPSMSSVGTGITNNGARTRVIGGRLDVTTPLAGSVEPEMIAVNMPDPGTGRFSRTKFKSAVSYNIVTVGYGTTVTIDATKGTYHEVTATNATAFTMAAPTNPTAGQQITVTIRNTSGGALGAATWNAVFKMAAWTQPANGFSRSITFKYNGTNWIDIGRTTVDVPN